MSSSMDDLDLDDLANRLAREHQLGIERVGHEPEDWRAQAILTMATHGDRRVLGPLAAVLAGSTVSVVEVRAAGILTEPALHPILLELASKRLADDPDHEFWAEVAGAISRCDPEAARHAEQIEVALLAALQTSIAESGVVPIDVALAGDYPQTEIVFRFDEREQRSSIWNFDSAHPDGPSTIDVPFTMYRLANTATRL